MDSKKDKSFYAEAAKGYTFKVAIDSLAMAMPKTIFTITKKGLFHRKSDEAEHILYDMEFPRENFRPYICHEPLIFSLNLKHLQKMVRNVKKKDSIVIYIDKKQPDILAVTIKPSGSTPGPNSRVETLFVSISRLENDKKILSLPEFYVNDKKEKVKVYGYPKVIDASDFQKMKKMTTVGKTVKIQMQKNNYISFYSDNGKLYGSTLEFGEIMENPESDVDEEEETTEEYVSPASVEAENEDDIKGWYEAEFHMNIFSLLMKLPGLCTLMQFYAPRVPGYPLKIQMNATNLGMIKIYIKDKAQIEYEQDEIEKSKVEKEIPHSKTTKKTKN